MSGYDVIGDVHGEGTKLRGLLEALGYELRDGAFRHPERRAVFVGDLIDRGDEHVDVLAVVRAMVDAGAAQIVIGNHEFNAIAYATPHPRIEGEWLRRNSPKNRAQHEAFLAQIEPAARGRWLSWFKSLPLFLELDGGLRVVHACWHEPSITTVDRALREARDDLDSFFIEAATTGGPLSDAVELLLKGPELTLERYGLRPFLDKAGVARGEARIRWWRPDATSVDELAEIQTGALGDDGAPYPPIAPLACRAEDLAHEYRGEIPVIFGHYWRSWPPTPGLDWTPTAACVDFSAGAGGPLVAYRWSGERQIDPSNYVASPAPAASS
jgi:hypothetical protein